MTISSFYFICVSAVLINKVSLQVTVEGFIGSSVVLPCSSAKVNYNLQDIDVFWRHNGSNIVFDIIKGKDSTEQQDQCYKNRVEPSHDDYLRGNFSIKLNSLQHSDAGQYSCLISHSSEPKTVELSISETTTTGCSTKSPEPKKQETETCAETSFSWVYITVPVLIVLFIACLVIFALRKKIQATFTAVSTEELENSRK